ncbi:MAG: hypothetical protein ACTSSA_04900 [Candidatus Freyarchaeota archaeon]
MLTSPCDILIPAAKETQIVGALADDIHRQKWFWSSRMAPPRTSHTRS